MKTCGYCGHQNEDTAATCGGCGKALKLAATKGAGDLKDSALDPVIVATFENTEHAGVLKAELVTAGIEAWIPEEFSFEFPPQSASVQVAAKDAAAAREIAADFRKRQPPAAEGTSPDAVVGTHGSAGPVPNTRPCVSCGAPISHGAVLCPKCGWTQPQLA